MEKDFTKMSDDQLVAIVAVPPNNDAHRAAAIELHKRQKKQESNNFSLQKWILRIAIVGAIIAAITLGFMVVQFFQHPQQITSNHGETYNTNTHKKRQEELNPSKGLEPLKENGKINKLKQ